MLIKLMEKKIQAESPQTFREQEPSCERWSLPALLRNRGRNQKRSDFWVWEDGLQVVVSGCVRWLGSVRSSSHGCSWHTAQSDPG